MKSIDILTNPYKVAKICKEVSNGENNGFVFSAKNAKVRETKDGNIKISYLTEIVMTPQQYESVKFLYTKK